MTDFDEIQFPVAISKGASGGPRRKTQIVTMSSGYEERNALWAESRRQYDAGVGITSIDELHDVLSFFEGRDGRLRGFRWKDWADFKSCKPLQTPTYLDQLIGTGNGSNKVFQLTKTYTSGSVSRSRTIKKPVAGTILVSVNGVQTTAYTIDTTTGIITFTTAPPNGHLVKAGYEFDVPVRFMKDEIDITVELFSSGLVPDVNVIEVKV